MNDNNLLIRLLAERDVLLADGATGTNLFDMGLQSGDAPELWNIDHPQRIESLHQNFCDAGSDLFLTNTFGGTRYRLKLHSSDHRVHEINLAAARIARKVADAAARPVVVAGSMGPTGEILAPIGDVPCEDVQAAFFEQAQALAEGGVDVLWLETMSSREELACGIAAANQLGLPVVSTMSFDTNGHSMMGIKPSELTALACGVDPTLLGSGANCGVGAAETLAAVLSMQRADIDNRQILVAKGNCGIPEWADGKIVYNGTPQLMAEYARLARDAGARIIGGCCGTTYEHVRAMRRALDETPRSAPPQLGDIVATLGEVSNGIRSLLGERTVVAQSSRGRGNRRGRRAHE